MRRIQEQSGFAPKDPYDERKKAREFVIANFFIFATFVGIIRSLPIVLKNVGSINC